MKRFSFIIVVISLAIALVGCAALQIREDDIRTEVLVKATTAEYLNAHPRHAFHVEHITGLTLAAIDAKKIITIDSLDSFVRAKANLDSMTAETQIAVDMLIKSVKQALIADLGKKGIKAPSEVMVQAKVIIGWVHETARVYARQE